MPGAKVTPEIAEARGVEVGEDCVSPATHSEFSTPIEMLEFIDQFRELSGGKPVGFKLALGHPWEWFAIVKAMLKTAGLNHPAELGPEHIIRPVSKPEVSSYLDLFPFIEPGALLKGDTGLTVFDKYWGVSNPESFAPPEFVSKLRETKLR